VTRTIRSQNVVQDTEYAQVEGEKRELGEATRNDPEDLGEEEELDSNKSDFMPLL
jgi:hypothetical protein